MMLTFGIVTFMLAILFCLIIAVGLVASFLLIIEQLNQEKEDVRDKQYH